MDYSDEYPDPESQEFYGEDFKFPANINSKVLSENVLHDNARLLAL